MTRAKSVAIAIVLVLASCGGSDDGTGATTTLASITTLPPVTTAVVAVCSGDGLAELFNNLKVKLLDNKKEKLFKKKDVSEWGVSQDNIDQALKSLNNAEEGFKYLLPNVSV